MSQTTPNFCPECGAAHQGTARFCGQCGHPFSDASQPAGSPALSAPPASAVPASAGREWQVVVGDQLPSAAVLFPSSSSPPPKPMPPSAPAATPGRPMLGQAFWMAATQAADAYTRTLESGAGLPGQDKTLLTVRLAIVTATALLTVFLRTMPRTRAVLVRLGTAATAVLQGQGLVPVLKQVMTDPSLLAQIAPNLAVQGAGLFALLKLFRSIGSKP